jgi:integron integrase
MPERPRKLLDAVRETIRLKHYSPRTEEAYVHWITRFVRLHHKRHPCEMGAAEIEAFLTHLAVDQHVAASTQNQALSAILFLYRYVLQQELDRGVDAVRARESRRLPTVLTREETLRVIGFLPGTYQLMAKLLYGSGLRLQECLQLRVKDVDFEQRRIIVHAGKGDEDRVTMLPDSVVPFLQEHLRHVKQLHDQDLARGYGRVDLPFALERKYPHAEHEWPWQYVFPASKLSRHPQTGLLCRHHIHESALQKAVRRAAQQAGLPKRVNCHTFRQAVFFYCPSPPTSWRTVTTSARSRNCSATRTCRRQCSIPTSSAAAAWPCAARWTRRASPRFIG